jgi:hypothetical protein
VWRPGAIPAFAVFGQVQSASAPLGGSTVTRAGTCRDERSQCGNNDLSYSLRVSGEEGGLVLETSQKSVYSIV